MILIFNPIFTLGWSTVVKDNRRIRFSLTNVSLPFLLPKRNHHSCFPTTVYPIYTSPTHRVRPTKKRTQSARTRHGPRSTAVNQLLTSADPHFFTSQCPVTCHPDWPIADPFQPPGKRTPCSKSCAQHTPRCCVLATATHLVPSLPPSLPPPLLFPRASDVTQGVPSFQPRDDQPFPRDEWRAERRAIGQVFFSSCWRAVTWRDVKGET